jgi:flavin reductase (DIM6/NTAB) family NADH-FMN oxidoreductase RutF/predicted ester cyclase
VKTAEDTYLDCLRRAWNAGDVDALDLIMAPGYVRHSPRGVVSLTELKREMLEALLAFPDLVTTVDEALSTHDGMVIRWSSRGTHRGTYLGVPATGRTGEAWGVTISKFDRTRVTEEHATWDAIDLLRSLGVSPLIEPPAGIESWPTTDAQLLRQVHRKFPTGVTVVTTMDDGVPRGLAVNAFSSLSLEPPLILVCVALTSRTHAPLMRASEFAVNILSASQHGIARTFAMSGVDKFGDLTWSAGRTGSPLIDGCAGYFEATIRERIHTSSHTLFVGDVVDATVTDDPPLIYLGGAMFDPSALVPLDEPKG